jgi:hypothetical protein
MHGTQGVDLVANPFVISNISVNSRALELELMQSKPVITISLNELGDREIMDLKGMHTDIIYISYEQHLGAERGAASNDKKEEGNSGVYNSCGHTDQGCPLNPHLQEYLHSHSHTLLVHKPHCVSADVLAVVKTRALRNSRGQEVEVGSPRDESEPNSCLADDSGSDCVQGSEVDVTRAYEHPALLFGTILYVYYPLRSISE